MTRHRLDRLQQMERQVASIERPRADEIALREMIIDAAIRSALAMERLADGTMIGVHHNGGAIVDKETVRAEMRASAAAESRRVTEMFKELRPLMGLSGEAWTSYMTGIVARAAGKAH